MKDIYVNITITRRIKLHGEVSDDLVEELEDQTSVEYPFDCEEIDGSVSATVEEDR